MRRVLLPLIAAALLVAATASPAVAAKPERFTEFIDQTNEDVEVCPGVVVDEHFVGTFRGMQRSDGTFIGHARFRITWTNAEGEWLENFVADNVFGEPPIENPDGTLTFVSRQAGIHERLRSSEGITPAFDRGTITFVVNVDPGDPEDPEDDVVDVDFAWHGPHPEAESDFALFCEVFTEVLG